MCIVMDFRKTNSTVLQHILNAKPLKYGNEIVLFYTINITQLLITYRTAY